MNQGRYVTLRLLEIECGYPTYYDKELEPSFKALDEEYNSFMRCKTNIEHISGGDLNLLKIKYVELLVSITKSPPNVDINVTFAVFMLSRDYVVHFQNQRNGMFATAICYWVGNFIDSNHIELREPRDSLYYKREYFMIHVNHVVVASLALSRRVFGLDTFFKLFYRVSF